MTAMDLFPTSASREAGPPRGAASEWEEALFEVTRRPRRRSSRPPLTMVLPASAQIPTPNREFLLKTPSEGVSYVATLADVLGWDVEIVDMRLGVPAEDAARRA